MVHVFRDPKDGDPHTEIGSDRSRRELSKLIQAEFSCRIPIMVVVIDGAHSPPEDTTDTSRCE